MAGKSTVADAPMVDDRLRAAINIPGYIIDLSLMSKVPIAHVVSHLIPYLKQQMASNGRAIEFLSNPDAEWHLEKFGQLSLDPEKTLEQEGMQDGCSLFLVSSSPGENYPALYDDVSETIIYNQNRNFPLWDNDQAVKLSLRMMPILAAVISSVLVKWVFSVMPDMGVRYGIAGGFFAVAFGLMATVITITKSESNRLNKVTGPMCVVAYICLASAAVLVIPREMSVYQLVTASAVLFTSSIFLYAVTKEHARLHYTMSTASLVLIIVTAFNLLYRSPPAIIGAQLLLVCITAIMVSSRISMPFAKIVVHRVPANGQPYLKEDMLDLSTVGRTPGSPGSPGSGRTVDSIVNQEETVLTAYGIIDGLVSGTLLVSVFSALFCGINLDTHQWIIWTLVLVISGCLLFRGKTDNDARRQAMYLAASGGIVGAFTLGMMFAPDYSDNQSRVFLNLGIIAFGTLVATVFSVQQRRINSPIVGKLLDIIDVLLHASLLPLLVMVMDLYQKARSR